MIDPSSPPSTSSFRSPSPAAALEAEWRCAANQRQRFVLALDSLSAWVAGGLTLMLAPFLQALYLWPRGFVLFIALSNLGFGFYSGILFLYGRSARRVPLGPVAVLVAANGAWALQCLFQVWRLRGESSGFGLAHLIFEAVYVGAVAGLEARVFFLPQRDAR